MPSERRDFLIARHDLRSFKWRAVPAPQLEEGQARLHIDRFALTANNITYALFGEKMRYWDFFPAPNGYGRVPVWGFADVVESRVEGLAVGERIYGYLPISTELIVSVGRLSQGSFMDVSPWRSELASAYNRYARVDNDPQFAAVSEVFNAVFRPLFRTSYLLADFFEDSDFFGAKSVLVSSASSKTSLGLGFLLSQANRSGRRTIGLTSSPNAAFVEQTGYFDSVALYDGIGDLELTPTIYADMAGGASVRARVHSHFADDLRYSCAVGGAHWEDPGRASGLPGPKPTLFFAPGRAEKRAKDWGAGELERRMEASWREFCSSAEKWVQVSEHKGNEAIEHLYRAVLEGTLPPSAAPIASVVA